MPNLDQADLSDILPTPNPNAQQAQFGTDEILWYDNGRWGECGYALYNPAGKTFTKNRVVYSVHGMIGRVMFELMHREDCYFYTAPHKQWFWDFHQCLIVARKRLSDRMVKPNSDNVLTPQHADPVPSMFLAFPVPYFGERIRQLDIREYCQLALMLLGEMCQHADAERAGYITDSFAAMAGGYLREMLVLMATKYFGYTRDEASAPTFEIAADRFTNYDPAKVLVSVEMTEERPPLLWKPTENDLSAIRGVPINEALMLAKRWPWSNWMNVGDGHTTVTPNTGEPGKTGTTTGAFVGNPNAAP